MEASAGQQVRPSVTIAICTYNRAHLLDSTLALMARLRVAPTTRWELVVVDNASTDGTAGVIQKYVESGLPLRTFRELKQGHCHARNRCVAEASHDWVLFTDDDVQVEPDWLENFVAAVERHPDAVIAGGPVDPWFPEPPNRELSDVFPELRTGFCGMDHELPEGLIDHPRQVYGANFALRRRLFETIQFDTQLGLPAKLFDEIDFIRRARESGGTVLWIPTTRVRHYVDPSRMTLSYLRRYRAMQGATAIAVDGMVPTREVAGMPLWLVRKWLTCYLRAGRHAVTGRRREALAERRQYWYYGGMLRECRALRGRRP